MLHKSSVERIYQDFGSVTNSRVSETEAYHEEIKRHFAVSDSTAYNDLANAAGCVYVGELTNFMAASLYPADGSWLEAVISPQADVQVQQTLRGVTELMREQLASSNFYSKISALIKSGILYNRGLMSVEWDDGLSFSVHDTSKVFMSTMI